MTNYPSDFLLAKKLILPPHKYTKVSVLNEWEGNLTLIAFGSDTEVFLIKRDLTGFKNL